MASTPAQIRAKRKYYQTHKDYEVQRVKRRRRTQMESIYEIVNTIKESTPCTDCSGKFKAICMDFDHVNGKKTANVSRLINEGYPLKRVEEEIAKCELVCANCHRIRTQNRG